MTFAQIIWEKAKSTFAKDMQIVQVEGPKHHAPKESKSLGSYNRLVIAWSLNETLPAGRG